MGNKKSHPLQVAFHKSYKELLAAHAGIVGFYAFVYTTLLNIVAG